MNTVNVKWGGKFKGPKAVHGIPGVQHVVARIVNLEEIVELH